MSDASAPTAINDTQMRVAFAHDWLVAKRGGELVLEALINASRAVGTPSCLYTLFASAQTSRGQRLSIGPETDAIPRRVSSLSALPSSMRRWLMPLYPLGVRQLSGRARSHQRHERIDLLVSTSSAAIKAMRPPPGVPHLCYCHSPARYVWSRSSDYGAGEHPTPSGRARELGLSLIGRPYRWWDRRTARDGRVTMFLANSTHTAQEIRRCYDVDAQVLHPPVRTSFFTPDATVERGSHWLVVSALEPYKRIDDAIRAAACADVTLEIVGTGSDELRLRTLSEAMKADVRWLGHLSDQGVRDAYRRASALLFPQIEDFGIVAVEALACGTPIAARRAGGAIDIVGDDPVAPPGVLYDVPDTDFHARDHHGNARVLAEAASAASALAPDHCRARAERFDDERFATQAIAHMNALLAPKT